MSEHTEYVCTAEHDGRACMFCDGGLSACAVCGAFEGAWTSDCPGERVDFETWDRVYAGKLDYRDGAWLNEPSPHTPHGWYRSNGPCPFLTCLETEFHQHPICPTCDAVRFGNLGCETCNRYHERMKERADQR